MILAINTSTIQFSIALLNERGAILAEYFMSPGSKNYGNFMPALDSALTLSESSLRDIEALIVVTGPGSFTGLRVGLSVVKGLAHGLKIPVISVSALEALANQFPYLEFPLFPMIDSRKGEVFSALFEWSDNHKMIRIRDDESIKMDDLPSVIQGTTIFLGNNFNSQAYLVKKKLGPNALLAPSHLWNLKASAVGALGLKRFIAQDFDDIQNLAPSYLRMPDIRPNPFPPLNKIR